MTFEAIMTLAARWKIAVVATAAEDGRAQSAAVGIAVSPAGDVVFDTLAATRKARNLRRDPRVSLVIGWEDEQTIQLEGLADEPVGAELEALKATYYAAFPDGPSRLSWPGLIYVRVRPSWVRYSDYRDGQSRIVEVER